MNNLRGGTIGDSVAKLVSPSGITENGEIDAVSGGGEGRGDITVSFFAMMMGGAIEGLNGVVDGRMEGDAVFGSGIKILEDMDG